NGVFDSGEPIVTDNIPEPFIDFRPLPAANPNLAGGGPSDAGCTMPAPPIPSSFCNNAFDINKPFELFIDTGNPGNGLWGTQGVPGAWDNDILVFNTIPITFSGPLVTPVSIPGGASSFNIPNGGSQSFTLQVHDDLFNPLVGGSTITVTSTAGTVSGGSITVPDGESFNRLVSGLTQFSFTLSDADATTSSATPAIITVTIGNSPNGSGAFIVATGTVN
ncbi:MAG TPA: hypothetical protein VL403_06750, partial [Candidatus Kryptonia bacterium]|nr:hypothetical protein [Candidatus Kryptonia bacterium]